MRSIIFLLIITTVSISPAAAQKKKKKTPPRKPPATVKKQPVRIEPPRIIGTETVVTTKNGGRVKGVLLDLSAYSIRIKSDKLESIIALETIASISFGPVPVASEPVKPSPPSGPDFARDADQIMRAMAVIASGAKAGADYTDYGHLLTDFRRQAEQFIQKYSSTESSKEARLVSLVSGTLTDYTWARTIWTLKLGRASDGSVSETDSPVVGDALALYPDLRAAASGGRISAEKLIGGLWKKAAEKIDLARSLAK